MKFYRRLSEVRRYDDDRDYSGDNVGKPTGLNGDVANDRETLVCLIFDVQKDDLYTGRVQGQGQGHSPGQDPSSDPSPYPIIPRTTGAAAHNLDEEHS